MEFLFTIILSNLFKNYSNKRNDWKTINSMRAINEKKKKNDFDLLYGYKNRKLKTNNNRKEIPRNNSAIGMKQI